MTYHKKNRRVKDVIPSVQSRFHESNANNLSIPYLVKVLAKSQSHLGPDQLDHTKWMRTLSVITFNSFNCISCLKSAPNHTKVFVVGVSKTSSNCYVTSVLYLLSYLGTKNWQPMYLVHERMFYFYNSLRMHF